ncbi:MAG TPA: lacto-N-biosidase [Enterococcus sp.]|nr:lacto-N-biosidase [Enterococcus sp.]
MNAANRFIYQEENKEVVDAIEQLIEETSIDHVGLKQPIVVRVDPALDEDFVINPVEGWISGRNQAELFHGITKYVLLSSSKEVNEPMTVTAKVSERCVMIDIGRKFYSLKRLKQLVRSMAWFQCTHLQLHFSENEGFRIESELFPEIVSEQHLKKSEIKQLIAYAKRYFIELIPDLDSPGHLKQLLHHYPEWQLPMKDGTMDERALNIVHPDAQQFIKSLYDEYAALFSGSHYFHIGADEFIDFDALETYPLLVETAKEKYGEKASGIEVFIEYVNDIIDHVRQLGFTVRVWNDGFYRLNREEQCVLSKACQVSYWTRWNPNMAPVSFYLENGYELINHNDNFFYYILGEAAGYTYPTFEKIQESFQLTTFAHNQRVAEKWLRQSPAIALSIWADIPEAKTAQAVIEDAFWLMAAIHQKVYALEESKAMYQPLYRAWHTT